MNSFASGFTETLPARQEQTALDAKTGALGLQEEVPGSSCGRNAAQSKLA